MKYLVVCLLLFPFVAAAQPGMEGNCTQCHGASKNIIQFDFAACGANGQCRPTLMRQAANRVCKRWEEAFDRWDFYYIARISCLNAARAGAINHRTDAPITSRECNDMYRADEQFWYTTQSLLSEACRHGAGWAPVDGDPVVLPME